MHDALSQLDGSTRPGFRITAGSDGNVTLEIGANLAADPLWAGTETEKPMRVLMEPAQALVITHQTGGTVEHDAVQKAVTELEQMGDAKAVYAAASVLAARPEILEEHRDTAGDEQKNGDSLTIQFYRYTELDAVTSYERASRARRNANAETPATP